MNLFVEKEKEKNAAIVTPEEKSEGDLLSVLIRKLGRPLKFQVIQDSNESVELQSLLTWQQLTIDFLKSLIKSGMWQSLLDRL